MFPVSVMCAPSREAKSGADPREFASPALYTPYMHM